MLLAHNLIATTWYFSGILNSVETRKFSAETRKFPAETGKSSVETRKSSAETGKSSAETGKFPACRSGGTSLLRLK